MVTLGSKRIHIVFTDSRGAGLQGIVNRLNKTNEQMEIDERKVATLGALISIVEKYLPKHPFDVVYLAGGVNDITTKDNNTGEISFKWGNGSDLVEHLISTLVAADSRFRQNFPASKVIFCPLIGSLLGKIVTAHPTDEENQITVNNSV